MKAFLLSAGLGTRLRPITLTKPKCLVPIGDKTLIEIWYKILENLQIKEILINSSQFTQLIQEYIDSINSPIETVITHEKELLGSAGTIIHNKDFLDNEPFWIIYTDNLTTANLEDIRSLHNSSDSIVTMGLFRSKTPELCGVVDIDENCRIIDFQEKPIIPKSDLVNAGIMISSPEIINHIPKKYPCDLSFDVFPKLKGRMYGKLLDDYFIDIGTKENYAQAQKDWAHIKDSFL